MKEQHHCRLCWEGCMFNEYSHFPSTHWSLQCIRECCNPLISKLMIRHIDIARVCKNETPSCDLFLEHLQQCTLEQTFFNHLEGRRVQLCFRKSNLLHFSLTSIESNSFHTLKMELMQFHAQNVIRTFSGAVVLKLLNLADYLKVNNFFFVFARLLFCSFSYF